MPTNMVPSLAIVAGSVMMAACLGASFNRVPSDGDATGGSAASCVGFTGSIPDDCDADLLDDGENCCIQERSCNGAACSNGQCATQTVAQSPNMAEAVDVVLVDDTVFWSTGFGTELRKASLSSATAGIGELVAVDASGTVGAIATDGASIYWAELQGEDVYAVAVAGLSQDPISVGYTPGYQAGMGRVAIHGNNLYWATEKSCQDTQCTNAGPGAVWRDDKNTQADVASTQVATGGKPHGVAANDDWLFWTDASAAGEQNAGVYRMATVDIPEASAEKIANADAAVTDIAIFDGRVYWLDGPTVYATDADTPDVPEQVGRASAGTGHSLAFDDAFVYWSIFDNGDIMRAPHATGETHLVATKSSSNSRGIAVNCDTVLFVNLDNTGAGSILQVTK